jgi:protein phosphatase
MIRSSSSHLHISALTHAGLSGKNNEDRFVVGTYQLSKHDPRPAALAVICDGIGGHRAGEVAAELAIQHVSSGVGSSNGEVPLKTLQDALEDASQAIAAHSAGKAEEHGMGATCVCALVIANRLFTAYVGDSRLYLLRGRQIRRLTKDHSWVQEAMDRGVLTERQAREHPNVHVIRRHLGSIKLPKVDLRLFIDGNETDEQARQNQGYALAAGDTLLLCSDGLTDLVEDNELVATVRGQPDLKAGAAALVELANQRGGHDNITVILMAMPRKQETGWKQLASVAKRLGGS